MTDQDKLNLIKKYRNNPAAFVEDMHPNIKLHTYQKVFLNAILLKNKIISFFNSRMNQKLWLSNMQLEIMKAMEMNFQVWSLKGIDVYEKGVLVRTIKHKKEGSKSEIDSNFNHRSK